MKSTKALFFNTDEINTTSKTPNSRKKKNINLALVK